MKPKGNANGWITKDTLYNSIGSVGSESLPYFTLAATYGAPTTTPALFVNYTYDAVGRPLTVANAVGTTTNTYSDWRTTITDPLGNKKDFYKDANDNLAQVIEWVTPASPATTTYTWNLNRKLTKITDALGNVRNFTYDALSRLLTSEDLHTPSDTTYGTTTYAYDDAGNTTEKVNPRNQTIAYTYDALNRVTKEDYTGTPGPDIVYTYDTCTNGKGRLCAAQAQGAATTTYTYGPTGLLATEARRISGIWSTTTTAYYRSGAEDTITYPDNAQVTFTYDAAGLLDSIRKKESGEVAWTNIITSLDYAPTGPPSAIRYANGVVATSTFTPSALYRLTSRLTKLPGGSSARDLSYTYDSVGNITRVVDSSQTAAKKTVDYTYDALYRLLTASTTNATTSPDYKHSFAYDILGNIQSSPLGSYSYAGVNYANPDALTQIVATTTISGGSGSTSTSTPAFVQSKKTSDYTPVTLTNSVTSGDLIVVGVTAWNQSIPTNAQRQQREQLTRASSRR